MAAYQSTGALAHRLERSYDGGWGVASDVPAKRRISPTRRQDAATLVVLITIDT